jgi:hypothetical protein
MTPGPVSQVLSHDPRSGFLEEVSAQACASLIKGAAHRAFGSRVCAEAFASLCYRAAAKQKWRIAPGALVIVLGTLRIEGSLIAPHDYTLVVSARA